MANPPNQTMRTTVETTYRTFGTNDIQDATNLIQAESAAIDAKTAAIAANSRALVENEMIQKRKLYRSLGINAPKQVVEGTETIVTDVDPTTGAPTQGIRIGYKIVERTAGEIAKASERQLRGRAVYAGMGRAGGVQALRDVLTGMSGTPLAGGAATSLASLNQAVTDIRGPDEAAAAQSLPLIKLINQNKKLFGRLARGGYDAGGVADEVKQLLSREDIAGAIERMRQADTERAVEKEDRSRLRGIDRAKSALQKQQERIEEVRRAGLPSYITGGVSVAGLDATAQTIRNAIRSPGADFDEIKFLVDSLKENIDQVNASTKTYKSASEAVKDLDEAITRLGSLVGGPGGAGLLSVAANAKAAFTNEELLRAGGWGAGTGFEDASRMAAGGRETIKQIQDRMRDQVKDLRREGNEIRGQAHREELTKRYARHPEGAAAAAKVTSALAAAEQARRNKAFDEAELHDAQAARAQADLELIDRRMSRSRYERMRRIGGITKFSNQVFGLGSSAISGDVAGLGGASVGMIGNTGQLLTTFGAPSIIKHGFAGAGFGANAMFFGGLALAGAGSLASAAYGRGAAALNRADAASANFLPAYEGFATANRAELMGSFTAEQHREMQKQAMLQFDDDASSSGLANYLLGPLGYADSANDLLRARSKAEARASAAGGPNLSEEEQAAYAQIMRQRVQDQLFSTFGQGRGNVSREQIAEAISASGRGFGTEFNVGARPEGMTAEMFGAGSAAAYANMRGLSVASIARLSSLGARFGVSNYSQIPGLVGAGGFGFRGSARDSFIDTINERISQAALGGETPELAMRNRVYQGAVNAGGDKEQLANLYAGSIGNMGDFRRGMFKGAADFSKKLMIVKAVSTGGSLQAADDLLAEQGAGFTEMDRLGDAMRLSPFMADAEMRFEGLSRKTREALKTSVTSGGGDVKEEPVTPESFFMKALDAFTSQEEAGSERSVREKADMSNISARFDSATSRFANAVQRFTAGILR